MFLAGLLARLHYDDERRPWNSTSCSKNFSGGVVLLAEHCEHCQQIHEKFINKEDLTTKDREDCEKKKDVIQAGLESLSRSISTSRRFTWQELDIPTVNVIQPVTSATKLPTR